MKIRIILKCGYKEEWKSCWLNKVQ